MVERSVEDEHPVFITPSTTYGKQSEEYKSFIQALKAERQKREEMIGRAIDMSIRSSGMPEHIATQMAEQMKMLFLTQPNNK